MLQQMRKLAKSWVSSIFLGALALSFGVWGVGDIFRGSSDTDVASVGGTKISATEFQRDYRNAMRNARNPDGTPMTAEQARAQGLAQRVLQSSITHTALDVQIHDLGLTTDDATVSARIRGIQAFSGPLGTFDHDVFLQRIQSLDYTEQRFIESMRSDMTQDQLTGAARSGFAIPQGYAHALFSYLNEYRAAEYVVVPENAVGTPPAPSDAALAAYEKAHTSEFSTPEYRQLTYVSVGPEDVANKIHVTDDQLKQEYDARKSTYVIPEKRDVEQITYPDEAAAKAAKAKIDAGESFADAAKDRKLGEKDIALGTLVEADLADARGPAAFALPENGVSAPVKFTFGWVLLHVTKITPGQSKSLDDVKEDLRKDLSAQLAQAKIVDVLNAFEDARGGGAALDKAGKAVGMRVTQVKAVDVNGLAPDGTKADVPQDPIFLKQVFAAEVGEEGDAFAVKDGTNYVLKVVGVTPPKLKPLDAVRAAVTAAWQKEQEAKQLAAKAQELTAKANAERSLASTATMLGTKPQSSGALRRDQPNPIFSPELLTKLYAVKGGQTVYGASADGKGYVIARVTGVFHPPLPINDPTFAGGVAQLGQQMGDDISVAYSIAARQKEGVTINQKVIDGVLGEGS